ncbi:MAG: HPr family phosphocarrier protein [Deltaproteobacteria bacterium]|nr:HPr family phosphocarrier protein [Deltaproteobacteria bacterium]
MNSFESDKRPGFSGRPDALGQAGGRDKPALVSEPVVVLNPAGIHARPAAALAGQARLFDSEVLLVKDGREADAKSVVELMGLAARQHDKVVLRAAGDDAAEVLSALVPFLRSGLGESPRPVRPGVHPARPPAGAAAVGLRRGRARAARAEEPRQAAREASTLDGRRIRVAADIRGPAEAEEVAALGGDGAGLMRSGLLFLGRVPSEAEQAAAYAAVARIMGPGRTLAVRAPDAGVGKPPARLGAPPGNNPLLGPRGVRPNMLGNGLFRAQARAVMAAARLTRLRVMLPMVSSVKELRRAKEILLEEKERTGVAADVKVGVVVEAPSAALLSEGLAREADFFSIGANDLARHTLAVDRGHPGPARMADALHPAVLKLVELTVRGAHNHGKWVGVCGGLASEILAVPLLIGLGVDELSVGAPSIPAVKAAVRRQNLAACRSLANAALGMLTAEDVGAELKNYDDRVNPGGGPVRHPATGRTESG